MDKGKPMTKKWMVETNLGWKEKCELW